MTITNTNRSENMKFRNPQRREKKKTNAKLLSNFRRKWEYVKVTNDNCQRNGSADLMRHNIELSNYLTLDPCLRSAKLTY